MLTRRGGTGRGEERARADLGGPRAEAGWDWETVGFFRGLIPDRLSSHRATSRASTATHPSANALVDVRAPAPSSDAHGSVAGHPAGSSSESTTRIDF